MGLFTNIIRTVLLLNCLKNVFCEKVIIIGAGPSGIAAATRLLENGIDNILVLEAEQRVGGRINTVTLAGKKIDLGAEWCHGQKGNIVYEKLEELNLLYLLFEDSQATQYYVSSRAPISYEFSEEFLNKTIDIIINNDEEDSNGKSVGEILEKRYRALMWKDYGQEREKFQFAMSAMEHCRHMCLCLEGAFSLYDVNPNSEYTDAEGYFSLGWKNGYGILFDVLTKKYPNPRNQLPIEDKIHLNKEVVKIIYNKEDSDKMPIRIECSDNSTYFAEHVIVTSSLGVLKERAESLFEPQLSLPKMRAIRNIGFGAVLKVFLAFDEKWWGTSYGFNLVWTDEDRAAARNKFPFGPTNQRGESWIVEIYSIFHIADSNILMVWFSGDIVPAIETMHENILKQGIHFTLTLFMGHLYDIPKPSNFIRTTWYSNPHFRGSYSYASMHSTGEDVRNLQTPIENYKGEPLVQFAGEATNPIHHSTVHGAVESGYREADRLIKLFGNK